MGYGMDTTKQKALDHYDRMIAWAEKQKPNEYADFEKMKYYIDEVPGVNDCDYCKKYIYKWCRNCELYGENNSGCCNGLHGKMCNSKTWKTWIKRAKKVREYIKDNG